MPLFSISPNIQETEAATRKRIGNGYSEDIPIDTSEESPHCKDISPPGTLDMSTSAMDCSHLSAMPPVPSIITNSPPGSSPGALTEAGSSTPARNSPCPDMNSSGSPLPQTSLSAQPNQPEVPTMPPASSSKNATTTTKAKRKTADELERERAEKKQKKEEKEALLAAKAAEKARMLAEREAAKMAKAKADAEREAIKKARAAETEAIRKAKAAEKAKADAEKEALRRKKEEDEQAILRKKEKQQNILASFLKRGPTTPAKKKADVEMTETLAESGSPSTRKEAEPERSAYVRQFKPFFVKPGVKLAPTPFEMDQETKDAKSQILDEFVQNKRGEFNPKPFNPVETFQLNGLPLQRGIIPPSVKDVMTQVYGDPSMNTFGAVPIKTEPQTESQAERLSTVQDQLNAIPMKYLSFYEDVRPPYFGTMTSHTERKTLRSLCVNPTGRTVKSVNYDYDSEAEWVEEEGDDLDDMEEDDEDHEGDEELDDFLDDSEDTLAANRPVFVGELQPVSTGLCFENRKRLGPCASLYKYKLEFLLDTLEHHSGIDPFSSTYWEPKGITTTGGSGTTSTPATTSGTMPPPSAPTDAFSKLASSSSASANNTTDAKDLVPKEFFEEFKQTVISEPFREHTKSTVIDLLSKKFTSCTKAQIKTTLDKIAQRAPVPGEKKTVKHWTLLAQFA